jgi:hypothetical protein
LNVRTCTFAKLVLLGATLVLALGTGCELVVGLDDLNNGQCGANEKNCNNRCVSLSDPATGCAALDSCAPCVLPHATAYCESGLCAIAACIGDYDDCDPAQPGCETDLAHDPKHCGSCTATACSTANGFAGCSARQCATGGCFEGWDDCNLDPKDGCERQLGTSTDCAGCDLACAVGLSCIQAVCR